MRPWRAFVAVLLLAGCAAPAQLPVSLADCRASTTIGGVVVHATAHSDANKPVRSLGIHTEFYRDFRYRRFESVAQLARELDPGATEAVTFVVARAPLRLDGSPQRCVVTRVDYLDGTHDDLSSPGE